jgi:hypothetical protein
VLRQLLLCSSIVLVAVAASTAAARSEARGHAATPCSKGVYSQLKTFSDRDRRRVNMTPVTTTVKALVAKKAPGRRPSRRKDGFERQVWRLVAQITLFRVASDGTMQLVLFDDNTYMQAELPAIRCVPRRARNRTAIIAARQAMSRCGPPTSDWQPLGAVAFLNGVGYWGQHGGAGASPNGAKLSPLLRFVPIAGCGAGSHGEGVLRPPKKRP